MTNCSILLLILDLCIWTLTKRVVGEIDKEPNVKLFFEGVEVIVNLVNGSKSHEILTITS